MVKLLLIEDDDLFRGQLAAGLVDAGHDVTEAANGRAGLRLFRETDPALVITDIVMDEGEGLGAIMELRREAPGLPIIAMSGNSVYLDHGVKLGASEALLKPFNMKDLGEAIARVMEIPAARSA